jgi:tRNA threonylcarbamoyladenosine biosynthesis protein TsaB
VNVLAVSTSTSRGSVALVGPRGEVATSYVDLQGHAERLFHAIDEVLTRASVTRRDVEAIACDVGPGSFTGVRVGVASMKGIALGLGVPLAGAGSLEAMAAAAFGEGRAGAGDVVLAAIDAKKSEMFLAAYDREGHVVLAPETAALTDQGFATTVARVHEACPGARIIVVGEVTATLVIPAGTDLARGSALDLPDATWIARVASPRFASAAHEVEPFYVRPPDAVVAVQNTRKGAGSG